MNPGRHAPNPETLAWMATAHAAFAAFDFAQGHAALGQVLARDPDFLPAQWARFQLPTALVHPDTKSIDDFRAGWREGVASFSAIDWNEPRWRDQIWGCVGQCTAFYRHYLGDDITEDQRRYGALVARMMRALVGEPLLPLPPLRERKRIVYASTYTYEHTVTRLFGRLLTHLDRRVFETHLLQLDAATDTHTDALVAGVAQVHKGPREARAWCELMVALAPDAIVYSDIGMHPLTQGLAALRLAPIQAVLWGHPVTTGLPHIDYFLSSTLLEPADADRQYSERLVRLPALGAALIAPTVSPRAPRSWPAPGREFVELLCAQSAFKLLPVQIDAFVDILAAAPNARLHLVPHANERVRSSIRELLHRRLEAAGADPASQLVLHPMLPLAEFRGLAAQCDLGLDTCGWSGGMSALDHLGEGLPLLTVPGASMRSRQTAALLEMLEVPELIARDLADYCGRARSLIAEPSARATLRDRIVANRERLYNTGPVHRAFGDFLAHAPSARAAVSAPAW